MLPTVTWDIDPIFIRLPREGVAFALGAFGAAAFLYGLVKKVTDQIWSGILFGVLALVVAKLMPENYGIRYYSILFVFVFLGGHALLKWQIRRAGGRSADADAFIVYGVLGVLLGARLGHVLFYDLEKALENPIWVLEIWTGGLASHGAVIGLITAMYLFSKSRGIPFLEGSDRFSFSAALGATLVRIGNLLNSEIVGVKTDGSWGFRFPRHDGPDDTPLRHPSQLYEITLGLFTLGCLYVIDRKLGREKRPRGALIASFFAIYFSGRFVIEFFKEYEGISSDSPLRMGQILSLPGILLGFYGLYWSFKRRLPAVWPGAELEEPDAQEDEDDEDDEEEEDEEEGEDGDKDETDDEDEEAGGEEEEKEDDEDRDRSSKKKQKTKAARVEHDDDVDDEFDAEGRLKRRRD